MKRLHTFFRKARRGAMLLFLAAACLHVAAQPAFEKQLQSQLILAEDGDTITLDSGNFTLTRSLSMDTKKNITIRGRGMDKTILSFKGQAEGAEGLKITNCDQISLEDFCVQDTRGDCIKAMQTSNIAFRRIKAAWTGKPSPRNGSYGLYPVTCTGVLIESCVAVGASDAGIYVGQSSGIVVRHCKAFHNVAGIEIENSTHADVYANEATMNTGGILVFDLPDLPVKKGGFVRVFDNDVHHNDLSNFAPKGNIVAKVPRGSGILVLAASHVEIYNNRIRNNRSAGVGIISYYMTENPVKDSLYHPYPTNIYVHDNLLERENVRATFEGRFGKMFWFKLRFGRNVPHILYDGIVDPATRNPDGSIRDGARICIRNNRNQSFANLDAEHNFKHVSRDAAPYDCIPPAWPRR